MNKRRIKYGAASLLLSVSSLFVLAPQAAHAAAISWDGEGADNKFSTAANWAGDVAPSNGDSITFPYAVLFAVCENISLENDLDANAVTFAGISFTGTRPDSCYSSVTITGNELKVSGDISANEIDEYINPIQVNVPITAVVPIEIQLIRSSSTLSIGSNTVALIASGFDGGFSGSGKLYIGGYESVRGAGGCSAVSSQGDSSNFTGAITAVDYGAISIIGQPTSLAQRASSITKLSAGYLNFQLDNGQDMSYDKPLTFNGGTASANQNYDNDCNAPTSAKTVTVNSDVTFTAETTFYLSKANINFAGTVTGKEFVKIAEGQTGTISFAGAESVKSSEKVTTVSDTTTCTSFYNVAANSKVIVNADCASKLTSFTVETPLEVSGTIAGAGTLPPVKIKNGGHIAPGNSPGCLTTNGLTFEQGSTYDFELGGTDACTGYDQIIVNGATALGNGTLSLTLYNNFVPTTGQSYTIISNDGTDAVTGTFSGLVQGATFTQNGVTYSISYTGGDGNDVVVTVTGVTATAAAPNTGLAQLTSNPVTALFGTILVAAGAVIARRNFARK